MAENSEISWTHHTFNPWWGCVRVSEACRNCYAEAFAGRFGTEWGPQARRRFFEEKHWREPRAWNLKAAKLGERHRVFCASMADVFEVLPAGHPDTEAMEAARLRLWDLIRETPHLDWLLLTKRPENIRALAMPLSVEGYPPNVWFGTTVESQAEAEKRVPYLLQVNCAVRFLSCEPLLGPLDVRAYLRHADVVRAQGSTGPVTIRTHPGIEWVICGGESGPGARPMHPDWARSLRDQCAAAGVAYHFKQWGEFGPVYQPPYPLLEIAGDTFVGMDRLGKKAAGRTLDGRTWDEFPTVAAAR